MSVRRIPSIRTLKTIPSNDSWGCCWIFLALALLAIFAFSMKNKHPGLFEGFFQQQQQQQTEPAPYTSDDPNQTGFDIQTKCHPSCCCETQWPLPAELSNDSTAAAAELAEFDKTSIRCRGCDGVGCLCAKKGSGLPVCPK